MAPVDPALRTGIGQTLRGESNATHGGQRQDGRTGAWPWSADDIACPAVSSDSVPAATQCWPELSPDTHPATNRILGGLMASSVLGGLGQLIALTVTGLLIEDLLGSRTWIGTGNAVMQIGTAGGAFLLSRTMARHGRRPGLVAGYAIGFCGGIIVGFGARWSSYGIVLVGLLLFGTSTTATLQARFAAADVVSDRRRARAVGLVVWSTTIGVVFGPKLSGPAGRLVDGLGFPELGGAYVVGGAVFLLAALVGWCTLRPDPLDISNALRVKPDDAPPAPVDVRACLRRPAVRLAISTLVVGQVVMVAIMSITAVHLRGHGYDLGGVGTIISGHVFGMYAPSPISGWLSDRFGRIFVIAGGSLAMVLAALLAATARPEHHLAMFTALSAARRRLERELRRRQRARHRCGRRSRAAAHPRDRRHRDVPGVGRGGAARRFRPERGGLPGDGDRRGLHRRVEHHCCDRAPPGRRTAGPASRRAGLRLNAHQTGRMS